MRENNRVENSHRVTRGRERKQQKFKSQGSAQGFLASHSAVCNTFNLQPHLISRPTLRILRAPGGPDMGSRDRRRLIQGKGMGQSDRAHLTCQHRHAGFITKWRLHM